MSTYESVGALLKREGEVLGTTEWQVIDQSRINAFADVTGDHQWIHVDERRALAESPFGKTVAHGALTLSLCTTFLSELIHVEGVRLVVNGGLNKVRFRAPVPVGSRIRGVATLTQAREMFRRRPGSRAGEGRNRGRDQACVHRGPGVGVLSVTAGGHFRRGGDPASSKSCSGAPTARSSSCARTACRLLA